MAQLYILEFSNGKAYVGITGKTAAERLKEHRKCAVGKRSARSTPVYSAWRKHGEPSMRVLVEGDIEYVKLLEISAIQKWSLTNRKFGYNLSLGGDTDPKKSIEVMAKFKEKMSEIHSRPEYRSKISESNKAFCNKLNALPGVREKASERMSKLNSDPIERAYAQMKAAESRANKYKTDPAFICKMQHGHALRFANNRNIPYTMLWRTNK